VQDIAGMRQAALFGNRMKDAQLVPIHDQPLMSAGRYHKRALWGKEIATGTGETGGKFPLPFRASPNWRVTEALRFLGISFLKAWLGRHGQALAKGTVAR
jgi:hypothetical protein